MFAKIESLDAFKTAVADKDEIRFNVQPNNTTVGCYMVSTPTTFDSPEAKECRGIVFDADGKVIARPLHKFFNVGEKESSRFENLDWDKAVRIMGKLDGSMIHTVRISGAGIDGHDFVLKSKKSYTSDVAIAATKWISSRENYLRFCDAMVAQNKTAIFEYISPTARIVVYYDTDQLVLLHVRDNDTGEYLMKHELKKLCLEYGVSMVTGSDELIDTFVDPVKLQFMTENEVGVEGWIVQFSGGDMVKLKTKWYLERHRAMTFLRERDIVSLVISEGLDDLKSLLVGEGADISEIEKIEAGVVKTINELYNEVNSKYKSVKDMSLKDAALTLKDATPYFGLVMAMMRGKEPDLKEWFVKNRLSEYSLRQLNIMQSVAEED